MVPANAYPPSDASTNEKATSIPVPPYVWLHIEAASTEITKEEHNKMKGTMLRRSSFLRNNILS
jgi:hypothetical protein